MESPYVTASEGSLNSRDQSSDEDGKGTSLWRYLPPPCVNREHFAMTSWKGESLILVGGSSDNKCLDTVEMYNFRLRSWTQVSAKLQQARRHCAAVIVEDRYLYVIGGNSTAENSFVDLDTVEVLDLLEPEEFMLCQRCLPFPIRNVVALACESRIFIVGGYSSARENDGVGNGAVPGYCDNVWAWDTNNNQCLVHHSLSQPRWQPAAVNIRGDLLIVAGGYNGSHWLDSVEVFHAVHANWKFKDSYSVPPIPSETPKVHGFWTRMNQFSILSNSKIYTWDWGSSQWRIESISDKGEEPRPIWKELDVLVPRSASSANSLVCLDSDGTLWELEKPQYSDLSIRKLERELRDCKRAIEVASKVGFWELAALDKAAAAEVRVPQLERMLAQLEKIASLQRQKDALVEGFVLSQSACDWGTCRRLAWDIRDVEEDLDEAHRSLRHLETNETTIPTGMALCAPDNSSPLRRGRSLEKEPKEMSQGATDTYSPLRRVRSTAKEPSLHLSFNKGNVDFDQVPAMERSYDGSVPFDLSSVDGLFEFSNAIVLDDVPPKSPALSTDRPKGARQRRVLRRQSSQLLQSLLSIRDLKELARSSDQFTDHTPMF